MYVVVSTSKLTTQAQQVTHYFHMRRDERETMFRRTTIGLQRNHLCKNLLKIGKMSASYEEKIWHSQ